MTLRQRYNQLKNEFESLVELYMESPDYRSFAPGGYVHGEVVRSSDFNSSLLSDLHEMSRGKSDLMPFMWRTRDGEWMLPSQMDEQHLRNSVSFCQRKLSSLFGSVSYLETTTDLVRALYEFLKEAKKRGYRV